MSKVTLTQEQADVLENIRADEQDYGLLNHWINKHAKNKIIFTDVFNLMTTAEFARAWIEGYEVEPQFEVGDVVLKISGAEFISGDTIGEIDKISSGEAKYRIKRGAFVRGKEIRHATELEKQLFALGRTEPKLKPDDIIVTNFTTIYRVSHDANARSGMISKPEADKRLENGNIAYVYPIETRIEAKTT